MKITAIKDANLNFGGAMSNSVVDFSRMTTSAVIVETDVVKDGKQVIGYGFNSMGRYGQSGIIRTRLAPRILEASEDALLNDSKTNFSSEKIFSVMMRNEKPGGHGDRAHAVGAIDMAIWDIIAKIEDKPLWRYLSDTYNDGNCDHKIFCYGAGGYYYPGKGIDALKDELKGYLDKGFETVKIKVGGASLAEDMKRMEAAIEVAGSGKKVAVDANGKFDLKTALDYAKAMEPYGILWFEEPGDPNDYLLHAEVSKLYSGGIAVGDNLFSAQDFKNMLLFGKLRPRHDFLQPDANLAYGLTGFLRILEMMEQMGWSRKSIFPHGGHLLCLHATAAFQLGGSECYPGVFQPFGGFQDDVILENGYASLPEVPGIGVEKKQELYRLLQQLR